ncbi:MAG: hypothetical protein RL154_835 [Pseudomonadota bacterium]|jgi:ABC-type uncharacterized transport system auxiliary subunit
MIKFIMPIAAMFIFAGCATKSAQPINYYTINTKAECSLAPKFEVRLTIDSYNDEYYSKAFYYTKGLEKQKYLYTMWSIAPVQNLQNAIINNFSDCGFNIIYNDMPISNFDNTKNLRVVLQSFDQIFDANSSSYANLRAQAWLRDGKDQKSKIFDIKVPAKTNDGIGGINAINSASSKFITELMKWTSEK